MDEHWTDRLSEYIDGDLDPRERAAADAHIGGCTACAALAAELRAVRDRVRLAPDAAPEPRVWAGVAAAIAAAPRTPTPRHAAPALFWRRRLLLSVPQLAAAAVVLVVASAGAVALRLGARPVAPAAVPAARAARTARTAAAATPLTLTAAEARGGVELERAASELEAALHAAA